mgnify:FL=1
MMTTEARVAAVKERVRARQQQKRLRRIAGVLILATFLTGALCPRRTQEKGE